MAQESPEPDTSHLEGKRFFIQFPPDWDEMSDEEQDQAAAAIAESIQRQLGII